MNDEIMRKLYNEYKKGVEREGKKGAVSEPLSYAYWKADFTTALSDTPKTGKEYSMTELRNVNKMVISSSKNQLSRKANRALENSLASGDWTNELSNEEAAEVEEFLHANGYYEAANTGKAREWFAFHGVELRDFLETMGLASWHMFFNS